MKKLFPSVFTVIIALASLFLLQNHAQADFEPDSYECGFGYFQSGSGYVYGYYDDIVDQNETSESGSGETLPDIGAGSGTETGTDEEPMEPGCTGYGFGYFDEHEHGFFDFGYGYGYEFGLGIGYGYGYFDSADAPPVEEIKIDERPITVSVSEEDMDLTFEVDIQKQDARDLALRNIAASLIKPSGQLTNEEWFMCMLMGIAGLLLLIFIFHKSYKYIGSGKNLSIFGLIILSGAVAAYVFIPTNATADKNHPGDFNDGNEPINIETEKLMYKVVVQNKGSATLRNCTLRIALSDKVMIDTDNFVYAQNARIGSSRVRNEPMNKFEDENNILLSKDFYTRIHVRPNERAIIVNFDQIPKHRGSNGIVMLIPVIPESRAISMRDIVARAHLQSLKGLGKIQYVINPIEHK